MKQRPPKAVFRYIEAQLYEYPEMRASIARRIEKLQAKRDEILYGAGSGHLDLGLRVQSNAISNPTESKGTRLAQVSDPWIRRTSETLAVMERILGELDAAGQTLVRLYYWERRLTAYGVARELHISVPSFYRYRRYVVWTIARGLGFVPDEKSYPTTQVDNFESTVHDKVEL